MAEKSVREKIYGWYKRLKEDRQGWEPFWRDVREYIAPQRGRALEGSAQGEINRGPSRNGKRIEGTASRALSVLANGMQSGVTPKAIQWFTLGSPDPELNRYRPVQEWYMGVQEVLDGIFRRSNFYAAARHVYYELGGFGTGPVMVWDDYRRTIFCRPFTVGTYWMSTDQYFQVDAFFYSEWKTVRQIVAEYGIERVPNRVRTLYDRANYEERFEVIVAVLRNPAQYGVKVSPLHTAASVHFMEQSGGEDNDFLKVGGFRTFPAMTPRWDTVDADVYGWSPTRDILGDVRMLQTMESDILKGISKLVSPPMRIPPELARRGLNMQAGATNVLSGAVDSVSPLFDLRLDVQSAQYKADRKKEDIREGLYNDLFLALLTTRTPQMTAREVAERHEEKLMMLGPVLERLDYEFLDPMIDRTFVRAWDDGLIPPPPPEIQDLPTQIEYVSILSQAQKAVGVNRIEQFMSFAGGVAGAFPEIRHAIRPYTALQEYSSRLGVVPNIMATEREYAESLQQEQQQIQMAQGAEVGKTMADGAKVMSDIDLANIQQLMGQGGLL